MTDVRVTQGILEVIRAADDPELRVTQGALEVIRQAPVASTTLRTTALYIEVLRLGAPPVARIFPIPVAGRITLTGSGTRVFPVPLG